MLLTLSVFLGMFFTIPVQPQPVVAAIQPSHCKKSFFDLPTWYKYLDLEDVEVKNKDGVVTDVIKCQVKDFELLGKGSDSGLLLIALAMVDILLRVAALVAVAFVIIGGFKYMTAQGEPAGVKSATQTLVGALVGLVIAIIATALVSFIGNRLG